MCVRSLSVARSAFALFSAQPLSSSMSLLRVLQSDLASVLMQYLDASHTQLLEIARPLRNSQTFAMAVTTQRGFNLFKFVEHLRGDVLCRRAVELTCGSENDFDRLWASIPETIVTTDFLAFACAKHDSMAYKYVPMAVRVESAFVRALVGHVKAFGRYEDDCPSDLITDGGWILDAMLEDREFALTCARKGIVPFGSTSQLYVHDQEIVEEYLKVHWCCELNVYVKISASPWYNRDWVLHMCRDAPMTAAFLLEHTNSGDLQLEIIEAVPENWVYETYQGGTHDGQRRIWRTAVRRRPLVMQIVWTWCEVLPSDQPLLTRAFLQNPMMYTHCKSHIRRLDYVAHIAFTHNGLQIRNSPFVDNKQLALTAVRQNGLALRWVSARLQTDLDVVLQAVRQNGLALAWSKLNNSDVARTAVQQNPVAAAFMTHIFYPYM